MDFKKEIFIRALDLLSEKGVRVWVHIIRSDQVIVPSSAFNGDAATLNITPTAVRMFKLGDKAFEFSATFSGTPYMCSIPYAQVAGVFCPDLPQLGVSMPVIVPTDASPEDPAPDKKEGEKKNGPSFLKVVK